MSASPKVKEKNRKLQTFTDHHAKLAGKLDIMHLQVEKKIFVQVFQIVKRFLDPALEKSQKTTQCGKHVRPQLAAQVIHQ